MKKILCILLAFSMIFAFAACGAKEDVEENAPINVNLTGTLEEIAAQIYAGTSTIEMMLMDPTEIDLADVDAANYYLGVASTDAIERAVFSEPMIGSIAYSMCLVKAKADADIEALKAEILEGVNYRKWMCVAAEKVSVVNCGDTIMMVMAQEEIVDDVCTQFAAVAASQGGEVGAPLEKAGEVQEDIPADGVMDMDVPADMPAFDGEEIPAEDGIMLG